MTTVYLPRLIESQDQADALPDGTVATKDGRWPRIHLVDGNHRHWAAGDHTSMGPADMTGWTALVAVEAEEKWAVANEFGGIDEVFTEQHAREYAAEYGNLPQHCYVTQWVDA
jgi:hypothetical protein